MATARVAGTLARSDSLRRALPDGPAHEKRPEPLEIERRLLRLPHRLDDRRERKQLFSEQADDEVVVVLVEPMTGRADVVRETRGAEGHADGAVLREDDALLF